MRPDALRAAYDGAEVVRVRYLVADDDEGRLAPRLSQGEDVVQAGVFADGADRNDALVRLGDAHGVELSAVAVRDAYSALPRQARDVRQGLVRLAAGDIDLVQRAPRAQRLQHRVAALYHLVLELVHAHTLRNFVYTMIPPRPETFKENLQTMSSICARM